MNYQFNIALNGKHFLGTHERSCGSIHQAADMMKVLNQKFPRSEGYEVRCVLYRTHGTDVTMQDLTGSTT
jgi:hypothetical protein